MLYYEMRVINLYLWIVGPVGQFRSSICFGYMRLAPPKILGWYRSFKASKGIPVLYNEMRVIHFYLWIVGPVGQF